MKTTSKKEEVKQEVILEECFVVWKNTSKTGSEYLKGKDFQGNKVLGYFNTNKKNPKEPDIRIYNVNEEGKTDKEIVSLWEYVSKNEKRYLSGLTDEKEKVVAFYGSKEKQPYIRAYFKQENDLPF